MLNNVSIFSSDKYWQQIFADLGAKIADSQNFADVVFDDINIATPIRLSDLQRIIFDALNNTDIITDVFGKYIILPKLQHKIIIMLYKNPNITMHELKNLIGILPDVSSHAVENALYQLRKKYGRDFIINQNGKYKIGRV